MKGDRTRHSDDDDDDGGEDQHDQNTTSFHVLAGESWRSEASGLSGGWLDE